MQIKQAEKIQKQINNNGNKKKEWYRQKNEKDNGKKITIKILYC